MIGPAPTNAGMIPNPWNQILGQKHGQLKRAIRYALATSCDPSSGAEFTHRVDLGNQLKIAQINSAAAGDTIVIPALAGVKEVFEVVLWNVAAQTIIFQQGGTGTPGKVQLLRLTSFTATTGFTLGFNGNFRQPHWEIDNNQSLVIVTAANTQVDGFVRYRIRNGIRPQTND